MGIHNALGGLKLVMPGVLIVLVFSFASLCILVLGYESLGVNVRKTSLVSLAEQYHDHD